MMTMLLIPYMQRGLKNVSLKTYKKGDLIPIEPSHKKTPIMSHLYREQDYPMSKYP